ncbi:MAG TPA: aromatic amino acid lyase, partial [Opitutaceae bacterium]|nr:aromatic amino acid lyase [Opitutaceae bacterium]
MPKPVRPATVTLDGRALTPAGVHAVAVLGARVRLNPKAHLRMQTCRRALVAAAADGAPHYGVNTGFGSLARQRIAA